MDATVMSVCGQVAVKLLQFDGGSDPGIRSRIHCQVKVVVVSTGPEST